VGCWLFNEGGGDKVFDLSKSKNNGVISGASWTTQGTEAGLHFNGTSDYMTTDCLLNIKQSSIIALLNTTSTTGDEEYCVGAYNDNILIQMGQYQNLTRYATKNGSTFRGQSGNSSLNDGRNHMLAVVSTDEAFTIYLDGVQDASPFDISGLADVQTTIGLGIGARNSSGTHDAFWGPGDIIAVWLYHRPLLESEITQLYAEPYSFILTPQYWYMVDFGAVEGATYDVSFSLAQSFAISDQATADAQAAVTLSQGLAVSDQSNAIAEALTSLSKSLNITIQADAVAESTLSLAVQLAMSLASEVVGEIVGQISLPQALGLAVSSDAQAQAALTLAYNMALSTAGTIITEGVLSLAIQKGLTTSYVVTQEAVLSLAQALGLSSTATATAEGQVALAKILAVSVLGQALAEAGVSLDQVVSVTLIGTTIIAGLETPDGRKYTISVEVRTMDIEAESRTLVISPENRTVTIN